MGVWLVMEVACSCWSCCHADFKRLFMELWYCWSLLPFYGHSHHPMACRHWIREQWSTSTCHVQGIAKTEHFIFSFREDCEQMIESFHESGKDHPWGAPLVTGFESVTTANWIWVHSPLNLWTQPVFNITLSELLCLLGFANIPASSHAAMT